MGTCDRHGRISWDDPHNLPNPTRGVNAALHVLELFLELFSSSSIERRPLPGLDRVIDLTSVVQARYRVEEGASERDIATAASDLLPILTDGVHGAVRGGEISPGVGLWARTDDPGWLVMRCRDTDSSADAADWLLLGPLWKHEVAVNEAQRQFD